MSNISAIVAGIAFVALAAANVVVMLEAFQPSRSITTRSRLIAIHRASGYLFVILLCIMAYSMSQRFAGLGISGHLPTHLVMHIALVLVLVPRILLKILIARHYKHSHSSLKALGIAIFVISFVLAAIPTLSATSSFGEPWKLGAEARDWFGRGVVAWSSAPWVLGTEGSRVLLWSHRAFRRFPCG